MKKYLKFIVIVSLVLLSACSKNDDEKVFAVAAYNYRKGISDCLKMGVDNCQKLRNTWTDDCIDPSDNSNTCEKYKKYSTESFR